MDLESQLDDSQSKAWRQRPIFPGWDVATTVGVWFMFILLLVLVCVGLPILIDIKRQVNWIEKEQIVQKVGKIVNSVEDAMPNVKSIATKADNLVGSGELLKAVQFFAGMVHPEPKK